jgi:hypothetical protein
MNTVDKAVLFLAMGFYCLGISFNCPTMLNIAGGGCIGVGIACLLESWLEIKRLKERTKASLELKEKTKALLELMESIEKHKATCPICADKPNNAN